MIVVVLPVPAAPRARYGAGASLYLEAMTSLRRSTLPFPFPFLGPRTTPPVETPRSVQHEAIDTTSGSAGVSKLLLWGRKVSETESGAAAAMAKKQPTKPNGAGGAPPAATSSSLGKTLAFLAVLGAGCAGSYEAGRRTAAPAAEPEMKCPRCPARCQREHSSRRNARRRRRGAPSAPRARKNSEQRP